MLSSHTRAKINMVRPPAPPVLIHALSSVSRHPVRSDSVLIVKSRTDTVAWALCGNAPFPVPARQTGRADFPHPAFRLGSPRGTRRAPECGVCCQRAQYLTLSCRIGPCTPTMHDGSHCWRKPDRATQPSHAPFRPATLVPVLQAARTEHACGGHVIAPVQSDLLVSNGPSLADFAG